MCRNFRLLHTLSMQTHNNIYLHGRSNFFRKPTEIIEKYIIQRAFWIFTIVTMGRRPAFGRGWTGGTASPTLHSGRPSCTLGSHPVIPAQSPTPLPRSRPLILGLISSGSRPRLSSSSLERNIRSNRPSSIPEFSVHSQDLWARNIYVPCSYVLCTEILGFLWYCARAFRTRPMICGDLIERYSAIPNSAPW